MGRHLFHGRGDVGLRSQTATLALVEGLGLARASGVVIADVLPGSQAARAGLRPGNVVRLEVFRDGQASTVHVAMTERLDDLAGTASAVDPRQFAVPRLGLLGTSLSPRVVAMLGPLRATSGVLVLPGDPVVVQLERQGELRYAAFVVED